MQEQRNNIDLFQNSQHGEISSIQLQQPNNHSELQDSSLRNSTYQNSNSNNQNNQGEEAISKDKGTDSFQAYNQIHEDDQESHHKQNGLQNSKEAQEDDEWEELSEQCIVIDYTKIQELVKKMNFQDQASSLSSENLSFSEEFGNQLFQSSTKNEVSQQPEQRNNNKHQQQDREDHSGKYCLGLLQDKRNNLQWFDGEFHPVVGTSVLIEIDQSTNSLEILGQNEIQFQMNKRIKSYLANINRSNFLKVPSAASLQQTSELKQASLKKGKQKINGFENNQQDRKREKKKKWKLHSKISVQKIDNSDLIIGTRGSLVNGRYKEESGASNLQQDQDGSFTFNEQSLSNQLSDFN